VKSIQIPLSKGIQISGSLLLGIYFSFQYGVKRKLLAKFHQNPSYQEIPINFSLFPPHRGFSEILFKSHSKSEEVYLRKVVLYLKYFSAIFYFKFF
jgi:hypothetical protein